MIKIAKKRALLAKKGGGVTEALDATKYKNDCPQLEIGSENFKVSDEVNEKNRQRVLLAIFAFYICGLKCCLHP